MDIILDTLRSFNDHGRFIHVSLVNQIINKLKLDDREQIIDSIHFTILVELLVKNSISHSEWRGNYNQKVHLFARLRTLIGSMVLVIVNDAPRIKELSTDDKNRCQQNIVKFMDKILPAAMFGGEIVSADAFQWASSCPLVKSEDVETVDLIVDLVKRRIPTQETELRMLNNEFPSIVKIIDNINDALLQNKFYLSHYLERQFRSADFKLSEVTLDWAIELVGRPIVIPSTPQVELPVTGRLI